MQNGINYGMGYDKQFNSTWRGLNTVCTRGNYLIYPTTLSVNGDIDFSAKGTNICRGNKHRVAFAWAVRCMP